MGSQTAGKGERQNQVYGVGSIHALISWTERGAPHATAANSRNCPHPSKSVNGPQNPKSSNLAIPDGGNWALITAHLGRKEISASGSEPEEGISKTSIG